MKRISLHTEIPVEQNLLFACFKYVHIILEKNMKNINNYSQIFQFFGVIELLF